VYLVGAGPGDPELLTVKAQRLLAGADVVVYDRLVPPAILERIRPGAPRIYVGKANGRHTLPQEEINDLLVTLARGGRRVVRLKGGDPFIFGRGSEETAHLARHGVAFEVVPGITAAAGCAAALGLPLTQRGVANGIRFVTGHACGDADLDLNWESLADPDTTLVVYMGLANIGPICRRLVAAGLAPDTPAIAVASGTTPDQAVCHASLEDLPARIEAVALASPVVIFIGRAAGLADLNAMTAEDDAAAPLERSGHG
jgi:uroporphyrin-III C-methyltransferase/precorrin-2 dehydrogenase/sirohydrochlorin ferrochelatase/uroporphyrin-III C-methyltransferase